LTTGAKVSHSEDEKRAVAGFVDDFPVMLMLSKRVSEFFVNSLGVTVPTFDHKLSLCRCYLFGAPIL
jgi:hypothetical protein